MAASMERGEARGGSSSVSDSSDDEELQRLQEAAVTSDYSPISKCSKLQCNSPLVSPQGGQSLTRLPSRRAVIENEEENNFGTTPEFRAFVAKKLAEKLDREIKFCMIEAPESQHTNWAGLSNGQEDGVSLFSDSDHLVYAADAAPPMSQHQRRRKASTSSSNSSEDERLASAAVTEDFLIWERAMLARLNPNPPNITVQDSEATPATTGAHSDNSRHSLPKKKKKKKKKHKKTEECLFSASDESTNNMAKQTSSCGSKSRAEAFNKKRASGSGLAARERSVGSKSKTSDRSTMEPEDEVVKKQRKKTVDVCLSAANQSIGSKPKTSARCTMEAEDEVVKKRRKKRADVCLSAANQTSGSKLKTSAMYISGGDNQIVKRRKKKDAHKCRRKTTTVTIL